MRLLLTLLALLLLAACDAPSPEAPAEPGRPPTVVDAEGVIVHLFEWRWDDVAAECETFLGPAGYRAVQVSPPTENAVVEDPPRPWWERYQPVSYRLENRSGDRAAFAGMVARCKAAGVDLYVDAVLNHMTGVYSGRGTAGSTFSEYDYPGLYDYDDFHHCGLTENDDIRDFNDPEQVRNCELVNLADLATEKEEVRDRLAAYLNDLIGLGVAGIRIDAAKHMPPEDLHAVLERLDGPLYVYQEVIEDAGTLRWAPPYFPLGDVTEFRFGMRLSEAFRAGRPDRFFGTASVWEEVPFIPDERALVFIDNHDNQRGHGAGGHVLTHRDGRLYELAVAFMLAYPYGRPRVMSSYAFTGDAQGPPHDEAFNILRVHRPDGTVDCGAGRWVCEHRRPAIAGMVGFYNATASARTLNHVWTGPPGQIAFGRGGRGFFALNLGETPLAATLPTGMAPGTYCNVIAGEPLPDGTGCTGPEVTVRADGTAVLDLPPGTALAFHAEARVAAR
ncbi:alpha-amylase family protein [Rhodocaloribacter litoris]|uniref:alpha-amylase n=1 Tax=Rhodocaloribacter litoris TaxID=2558931 RepID=UPI001421D5A2|nr:alpha-amylase family protein [Rhodocaloribacter litoris]QXD16432.1 alpha-amylase family protein [Rhodocaloribacter litoris]